MSTLIKTTPLSTKAIELRGWLPLVLLPAGSMLAVTPLDWPDWGRMWLLVGALYAGFKWLTYAKYARRREVPLPWALSYLLLWPGMNADAFFTPVEQIKIPVWTFLLVGLKICFGSLLLMVVSPWLLRIQPLLASWSVLTGVYFLLHSGLMHGLALLWQAAGLRTEPLMHWPLMAASVAEYWGRRWNTAFRDLAQKFLFRPLVRTQGAVVATGMVFLFSGVVHDIAISIPSRGGYGLPTLYFLIQGAMLLGERSTLGRRLGLGQGVRGRVFALFVVLLPAPLLFHQPFMRRIVIPMIEAIQAAV